MAVNGRIVQRSGKTFQNIRPIPVFYERMRIFSEEMIRILPQREKAASGGKKSGPSACRRAARRKVPLPERFEKNGVFVIFSLGIYRDLWNFFGDIHTFAVYFYMPLTFPLWRGILGDEKEGAP